MYSTGRSELGSDDEPVTGADLTDSVAALGPPRQPAGIAQATITANRRILTLVGLLPNEERRSEGGGRRAAIPSGGSVRLVGVA
jgi:hypothetical protein